MTDLGLIPAPSYIELCSPQMCSLTIYCDVPGSPCLSKKGESNVRFVPFKFFYPPVDGPKDPWPCLLSLLERFVGDAASLARDNIKGV